MTDRPRGGLIALCIAELVSWGLLYYSLPVAVEPISRDMGWSHTVVTAALSLGLVISAIAGIRVGKLLDSYGPRSIMSLGTVVGVLALLLVAWAPNLLVFYLAWVLAGFAQAATLVVALPNTPADADPGDMIAMASTLAVGAWGDALSVVTMAMRGHTLADVVESHPAGGVGHRGVQPGDDAAPVVRV